MAEIPTFEWTRLLGASSPGDPDPKYTGSLSVYLHDRATAVSTDINGSVYITGYTFGNLDEYTNKGSTDIFVAKYSSDGKNAWTQQLGSSSSDRAYSIDTANDGSIYIAGTTSGNLDGQPSNGNDTGFITKLNSDGSREWTKLIGQGGGSAVTTHSDGSIYLVAGGFVGKYRSDGASIWTQALSGANSVSIGVDGSVYVAGSTRDNLDGEVNSGHWDAFVTKYNSDGSKVWTRLLGSLGHSYESANSVSTAADGSIYIAGVTNGSLDGSKYSGGGDAFLSKFNRDGSKEWTQLLGSTSLDYALSVSTAADGSIYIAGRTEGNLDGQRSNGDWEAFVTKFNADGSKLWTRLLGTSSSEEAHSISATADGEIYIVGYTEGNLHGEVHSGGGDAFITKYSTYMVDAPGVKINLPSDLTTDENGKSVKITLVLKTQPSASVRLDFALSKDAEATLNIPFVEFTAQNWYTPQVLVVKGVEDYIDDADKPYTLTITGTSTDKTYQSSSDPKGLQIPVINLANLDDGEDEGKDIYGDPGAVPTKDNLKGTEGADRIYGLLTDDILYGGPGNDLLFGGYGNDVIYGEEGNDELYGENEADTLYGGEGNDRLTGGEGKDLLIGGPGNDIYIIDDERDTIDDQGLPTDIDTVLFRANLTAYTLPASIKNGVLDSGSAFKLIGNALDNNLKGNDNNNDIDGGDGDDVLDGGGGDDTLKGGSGSDTAHYAPILPGFTFDPQGGASITANLLTGIASGTEIGTDTLIGIENIETADGDDTLIGNNLDNRLVGNGGNDNLQGNDGNDIFVGGQGDDSIDGGLGNDQALYSGSRENYTVTNDSATSKVTIKDQREFHDGTDIITGIESFKFADITLTLSELISDTTLTTEKSMDLNGDGIVNKFDSMLMMRHMLGTFPGESIKKDIPGTVDLAVIRTRINQIFSGTFSLGGGLKLDIDGDNRISAFSDGLSIMTYIHHQHHQPMSPWAPPIFIQTGRPGNEILQHLEDLIGF